MVDNKTVEIVYVSSDRDETAFKESYAKMPWLTYRWESGQHEAMRKKFDVKGVPLCYVLSAQTGFLISKKGRKDISELGVNCLPNWVEEYPYEAEK